MQILATLCLLLFVASTTVVGGRLLWVGATTRRSPELLLGLGSLLIGTIGMPLSVASGFGGPAGQVWAPLWIASEALTQMGIVCMYAFTQRVFRPRVGWARAIVVAAAIALATCLIGAARRFVAAPPDALSVVAAGGWMLACQILYGGAFAWSAAEGLHQFVASRRRLALGLADPLVTDRFRLFAIYGIASTGISIANAVAVVLGLDISVSLLVLLPLALLAPIAAGAMYLAILPPSWYAARVRLRAAAIEAAHVRSG